MLPHVGLGLGLVIVLMRCGAKNSFHSDTPRTDHMVQLQSADAIHIWLASPVAECIAIRGTYTRLAWLPNPNPNPTNPNHNPGRTYG